MAGSVDAFRFAKLCCGGNDFIVADCRSVSPPRELDAFARALCDRRYGVGADGVIFLRPDDEFPFRMVLRNADGSPAQVSYNGGRCVGFYAWKSGLTGPEFTFASQAGPVSILVDGDHVLLSAPPPGELRLSINLDAGGRSVTAHYVLAGVPYLVLYSKDIEADWIEPAARSLRKHDQFPEGVNVAVAKLAPESGVTARFFERGVEEETPSSGSGCVALAAVARATHRVESPVTVTTRGGDFVIHFDPDGSAITNVRTSGGVTFAFEGVLAERFAKFF